MVGTIKNRHKDMGTIRDQYKDSMRLLHIDTKRMGTIGDQYKD